MAPIKARAQAAVDRVFYRQGYDPERVLSELSQALSSARALPEVERAHARVLAETLQPASAAHVAHRRRGRTSPASRLRTGRGPSHVLPPESAAALADGADRRSVRMGGARRREPLPNSGARSTRRSSCPSGAARFVIGALTLGRKESGRSYNEQRRRVSRRGREPGGPRHHQRERLRPARGAERRPRGPGSRAHRRHSRSPTATSTDRTRRCGRRSDSSSRVRRA